MSDFGEAQRIEAARLAQQALDEFLNPAFDFVGGQYLNRLKRVIAEEPWAQDKIAALVMAQRVVEAVRGEIQLIVKDGEKAKSDMIRVETVGSMSAARRRALGV
jgi:hypothetical protein